MTMRATSSMEISVGLLVIAIAVADIWAIVSLSLSNARTALKILWIAAVVLFPVIAFIAWLFADPKKAQ